MSDQVTNSQPQARRLLVVLPLVVFLGLAGLFLLRLHGGNPSTSPSAPIGQAKIDGVALPLKSGKSCGLLSL